MTTYPLFQILIYLSLLFAPPDATRITITDPDNHTVEVKLAADGWTTTTPDDKTTLASIAEGVLTLKTQDKSERFPLSEHISAAIGHDWATVPKLTLHDANTLEKTATGFVFRLNDGDAATRAYTIVYEPSSAAATAPAITVNVIGAVNAPGAYTLPANATLLDAIAAAKGFTTYATPSKTRLVRAPAGEFAHTWTIDAKTLLRKNEKGPALKNGDVVMAPEIIF